MELAKAYTPNDYEPNIYAMWEQSGVFRPQQGENRGEPYAIVMPPPNANGNLHVGHALMVAVEDILVRYHRMKGRDAVYLPGADHAGFETWVVYERELEASGKSRFDFSRGELYAQVWDFVDKRRGDMELQLRALGAGADWPDLTFTLDDKVIRTVYDTFQKLWHDGLIYRGERIVNYCTRHQTSFSDIEVVYKNEKGKLWRIAYPLVGIDGELVVATTRPETMLGDVAVAVHPDDKRYASYVGQMVELPILNKQIPVIADDYVDMTYGTGVVKITPAHDPNDFMVGERHSLEPVRVIGFDGRMTNVPHQFEDMTIGEARERVVKLLEDGGALRGEETIEHSVAHCYKCGTVIEPMLKEQWFVKMRQLAEPAIEAIRQGQVTFSPSSRGQVLIDYLEQLRDWNISRQIPWGIPIPAFQSLDNPDDWIFDTRVDDEVIVVNGTTYQRDEDTFDTWFSSSQWPYITTDYLDDGELARFYPTAVLETGYDILYAWVGRMLMMGLYRTGQAPFRHVYLHGLVNDEHNQKMSKSKGNVINPMEVIAEYGSDALRLGLVASRSAAQSQAFSIGKVIAGRNFCNKLWNVARFIMSNIDYTERPEPEPRSLADHWVIGRLNRATEALDKAVGSYSFAEAAEVVYHTLWDDVADWYVEASKVEPNPSVAGYVLETMLRLAHPLAPFVTETIWQALPWTDSVLAGESWPEMAEYSDIAAGQFGRLKKLVGEARYVIAELPGNKRYRLLYIDDSLVADNVPLIRKLVGAESIERVEVARGLRLAASGRDVWLDIDEKTLYEHQSNLEARLAETRAEIAKLEARLANPTYVEKAPAELVDESRTSLETMQARAERFAGELQVIS